MELNEYQKKAMTTCMESSDNFSYMMLNLVGEVGEFSSKVAKAIRKEHMSIQDNILTAFTYETYWAIEEELKKECGDIMWQLFGLISAMGWDAEEIAQMNLDKLSSRQTRGVIDGNGDNR